MKAIHPSKLKVGDKIEQYVHFDHQPYEMKMTGEVIWIHPKHEFYRVRYTATSGASFTESYRFYGKHSGLAYTPDEGLRRPTRSITEGNILN